MAISKFKQFISRHVYLTFFVVTCISYGQMLLMYVWKDDNAIFFKFTHLSEPAGYLGRGLLGEGPYRLSVAPYWVIYKIFGVESITAYYVLIFLFYFLASISLFKLFETLISRRAGIVAGLLFSAGYIASEGFYWLASSWILSVSIILTCFTVKYYYQYFLSPSWLRYIRALAMYVLCIELTPVRTHYVIALIVAIELLWGIEFGKSAKVFKSIARLIPFFIAFYLLYIVSADSRTASLATYFLALKNKNWYEFYSFFATASNIFVTDVQSKFIFSVIKPLLILSIGSLLFKMVCISLGAIAVFRVTKRISICFIYVIAAIIWTFFVKVFSSSPQISMMEYSPYLVFISGIVLITLLFTSFTSNWRKHLFLLMWFVVSLSVYTSYIPTGYYSSIDRYIAHTFVALVGLMSLMANVKKVSVVFTVSLLLWGVSNIYSSITLQHSIVINRSIPAKNFYAELASKVPTIHKGDVLYIDVSEKEQEHYAAAFSVGQMPESTAIAWRYGLDRYDFLLVNSFEKTILNPEDKKLYPGQVHLLFYDKGKLTDMSAEYVQLTKKKYMNVPFSTKTEGNTSRVTFDTPISAVRPLRISLMLKAKSTPSTNIVFPYENFGASNKTEVQSSQFRSAAYEYMSYKARFLKEASATASSLWQDREAQNSIDANMSTVWQPDRILWHDGNQFVTVDMKKVETINRIIWLNGFENNSPTVYTIRTSEDGINFREALKVSSVKKIASNMFNEIVIEPTNARYVRMVFHSTLNDDAPGISEIIPISYRFKNYDIASLETFLLHPFAYVNDPKTYDEILSHFRTAAIQVSWLGDKYDHFQTSEVSKIDVSFDNKFHTYSLTIPAGGTSLKQLNLYSGTIPGDIELSRINIEYD